MCANQFKLLKGYVANTFENDSLFQDHLDFLNSMRFLTRDEVNYLSPHVWRQWNPNKYKGGLWWKLEEFIDISGVLERPLIKHKLVEKHLYTIQYIPFGKVILKPRAMQSSLLSWKKSGIKGNISKKDSFLKQKEISCAALACCRSGNKFLALDSLDNLYFFDLDEGEFWKVMNHPGIQIISFCHLSSKEIVLGKSNGIIDKLSIDPEIVIGHFTQHVFPVKDIVFFSDEICLSYSQFEAWIWNCFTFEVIHSITFTRCSPACLLAILPNSNNLFLTILSDRTLHLWKRDITNQEAPRQVSSYTWKEFMMENTIKIVAFNSKCSLMALGGKQKGISLVKIEEEYWTLERILYLPQTANEVNQMKFIEIPEFLVGVKKLRMKQCLAVFTSPFQEFLVYDLEERHLDDKNRPTCILIDVESEPRSFHLTPSGALALFPVSSGFVDVYTTFWWLNERFCPWLHYTRCVGEGLVRSGLERSLLLPSSPLATERDNYRYVLWRLGELPPAERQAYWRLALVLPGNLAAFRRFVLSYFHPAVRNLPQQYPTLPKENLFSLTRLYSAFCYLSPLFYLIKDFPEILLRFCKVFTWSLMGVFECVLSIFNNYCSDWFVNYPNPPLKLMNILPTIVSEKDPELSVHFAKYEINVINISWSLMSNFFLSALHFKEWSLVWDHILFSDKYYVIMVTASLILNCRCMFLQRHSLENLDELVCEMRNSDFNIWSVIMIAYDLLDIYKPKENNADIFVPLEKVGLDQILQIQCDKESIWNAMINKENGHIMMDIELHKTIDKHKLLDPREHAKLSKTFFVKDEPFQHFRGISRISLVSYLKEIEEKEEAVKSEQVIFTELQREREYKFLHLQKLLEKRELHWISNRQIRTSDFAKLELFKSKWPEEYRQCEITMKTEPQKPPRKSKKHSEYHKYTIPIDERLSVEKIHSDAPPTRKSKSHKMKQPMIRESLKTPPKQTHGRSGQQGPKKRSVSTKRKVKSRSVLAEKVSELSVVESKEEPRDTVHGEYMAEWSTVKEGAAALHRDLESLVRVLEEVALRLRPQGEGTRHRHVPASQLPLDWRRQRREEFLAMLEELYEKLGNLQRK